MRTGLLILQLLSFALMYAQNKFDKIFIDESKILIGNIIEENDETIIFQDSESDQRLTLFKKNLLKVISKTGNINIYDKSNLESINFESEPDLRKLHPDYPHGFYQLDIVYEDPDEIAQDVSDYLKEEYTSSFLIIRILNHNPEYFWFEIKPGDFSSKSILMTLPINQYTIEVYEWNTIYLSAPELISKYLLNNPPQISEKISIEKFNTTNHRIVNKLEGYSVLIYYSWDLECFTREIRTQYVEENYKKFISVEKKSFSIVHNTLAHGVE